MRTIRLLAAAVVVSITLAVAAMAPVGAWNNPEPDHNGDQHSNCHTGSKFRGAGGNDKGEECQTSPPGTNAPPGTQAPPTPQVPAQAKAQAPPGSPGPAAASAASAASLSSAPVPVVGVPALTG